MSALDPKILSVYFSWSGFSEAAARIISQKLGADTLELEPYEPYPHDYAQCLERAKYELTKDLRPNLKPGPILDLSPYKIVFLLYPNWLGSLPRLVVTFLETFNLNGKILLPVCANGGGKAGRSLEELTELAPKAIYLSSLSIRLSDVNSLPRKISYWLRDLDLFPALGRPLIADENKPLETW
ncbi:MAG: hypothetical protein LBT38_10560 [Deltaproteobacteria bacterium]|jgi:flavodoxin|nr:hypothetical protein [Deltaproteobacteria bacterium]